MRKLSLYFLAMLWLLNSHHASFTHSQDSQTPIAPQPLPSVIQPASIDDREIYDCWMKEQQIALGAHKACSEFDMVREVRNAIAESSLDEKTKNALLTALDKKLIMLEKRAAERKNSLALFRKQQRDDLFLILGIMFPTVIGITLLSILSTNR